MNLIDHIKLEEGFRGNPYDDTLGFPTIGYGTKLPLTEHEALLILEYRLATMQRELIKNLHDFSAQAEVWDVLYAMTYQMGVRGVLNFKKMILALRARDYQEAARQMLDSRWAVQTPERANRLADRIRRL